MRLIKISFILIALVVTNITIAQISQTNYVANQVLVKDCQTGATKIDFGAGNKAVIVYYVDHNGIEWVAITLGTEVVYEVEVVNTEIDHPSSYIDVETKQGGVISKGNCVGTISIFRVYNKEKNRKIPEFIRTQVNGADVAFEFHGIIQLKN